MGYNLRKKRDKFEHKKAFSRISGPEHKSILLDWSVDLDVDVDVCLLNKTQINSGLLNQKAGEEILAFAKDLEIYLYIFIGVI